MTQNVQKGSLSGQCKKDRIFELISAVSQAVYILNTCGIVHQINIPLNFSKI